MSRSDTQSSGSLSRRKIVASLLRDRDGDLIVTGLGSASYDVHAAGDCDSNYYLWGAMGGAALVGLGLAQAQPARRVLVITGDGEQLMALGGLATIAVAKPPNLTIIVLDNHHFGETGMQTSHTGRGIDLGRIAAVCGFAQTSTLTSDEDLDGMLKNLREPAEGPRLFVIKIAAENPPRSLPSRDAVYIKNRMRAQLGFAAG